MYPIKLRQRYLDAMRENSPLNNWSERAGAYQRQQAQH